MGNLLQKNMGLLFKWVWRFFSEPGSLWRSIYLILDKYGYRPSFTIHDLTTPPHGGLWRLLCTTILRHEPTNDLLSTKIQNKMGNDSQTLFWHNLWIGSSPLKLVCPRLFYLNTAKDALISSVGFWDGLQWSWSLSWSRTLRPQDLHEKEALNAILGRATLTYDGLDQYIWTPDKRGVFSIKNFGLELAKSTNNGNLTAVKGLWGGLIPYRIEISHGSPSWAN